MCGRYTLRSKPMAIAEEFDLPEVPPLHPRFNAVDLPRKQEPTPPANLKGAAGCIRFLFLGRLRSEEPLLPATRKVKKSTPLPVTSRSFPE